MPIFLPLFSPEIHCLGVFLTPLEPQSRFRNRPLQIPCSLCPKRDCGSERVHSGYPPLNCMASSQHHRCPIIIKNNSDTTCSNAKTPPKNCSSQQQPNATPRVDKRHQHRNTNTATKINSSSDGGWLQQQASIAARRSRRTSQSKHHCCSQPRVVCTAEAPHLRGRTPRPRRRTPRLRPAIPWPG